MSLRDVLDEYFGDFNTRFRGRYFGKFRGIVVTVADPKQIGRIRVRCPTLFGDATSGWCWPASAMGGNDSGSPHGFVALPETGDIVWIELEEGNTGRPPVWVAGAWSKGALPDHVRALPDESDVGIKGIPGMVIPGPSTNVSEYGKVRTWQMPSGAHIEFDETEGDIRVQVHHPSGAHIEMLDDGTINIGAAAGVRIQASAGGITRYSAGAAVDTIDGPLRQTIDGEWKAIVEKTFNLTAAALKFDIPGYVSVLQDSVTGNMKVAHATTRQVEIQGNDFLQVANQMSYSCGTDFFLQASGKGSLVAQNNITNGGLPTELALELAAYNGRAMLYSTDATGLVAKAGVEFDGTLAIAELYANVGGVGGEVQIDVAFTTIDHDVLIQIGAGALTGGEFSVLGTTLGILLGTIFTLIDAHTHIGNMGVPTTPAAAGVPPLATAAAWAGGVSVLSLKSMVE